MAIDNRAIQSKVDAFISGVKEVIAYGPGDTLVLAVQSYCVQLFISGGLESDARVVDSGTGKYAWWTLREQELDDLITTLEYAKLKITKTGEA